MDNEILIDESVLDNKNMLVMKIIHYLITERNYNPIVLQGAENEIWLENLDADYKIVRIVTGKILNDEQLKFDIFKTKRIIKKIKKKTFTFSIKALSIFLDLEDNINVDVPKNIEFVNIKNEKELKNNSILEMVFPDMKEKLKYTEEGMQLFLKITTDINEHNIKDNEKVEKVFKPKYPIITYILILLNVFMYIIPILCNKEQTILEQFCIFGDYVRSGEYYRLLTGTFLHANIIHLFCNMYALYILGTQLESFVGKIKFLIIYIFSALTGSLLSLIFLNNGISIGASGAIFGLTGALIYFGLHYRVYLGSVVKTNLIPIIVLNLLLGFMMKGIDNWAHIGGLIGGILCNMALGVKYKSKTHERINGISVFNLYGIYIFKVELIKFFFFYTLFLA